MQRLELGFVLTSMEDPALGMTSRWADLQRQAKLAEQVGFDTVWIIDELQWESEDWAQPAGCWECVAVSGAIAATTETIDIGTWVLSALHRNPGLTARVAETLHEISGERFIFGFGSGHAGRQAAAFGFAPNYTVSRYEEALAIITALRANGEVTFDGSYHQADGLLMAPRPDGSPSIPLMLGGHKPRTMRLAVEHADIWSGFATTSSQPEAFVEMLQHVESVCGDVGRDPATLGKSIGIVVASPDKEPVGVLAEYDPVRGSVDQITDTFHRFAEMGCTRLELMTAGDPEEIIEALAPVVDTFAAS